MKKNKAETTLSKSTKARLKSHVKKEKTSIAAHLRSLILADLKK
jgi:hypothetical protein